ncbi:MAG: 4-hydroxythreonine-4-phosphate dehydrogenase PdxA [Cyanobacteria bacterium P01_G01_bin.4]
MNSKPRIALTLGDPAGIGPEIVLKACAAADVRNVADIVVFGDRSVLEATHSALASQCHMASLSSLTIFDDWTDATSTSSQVPCRFELGIGSVASGSASYRYLATAIDRTLAGHFDAVVTSPIAKFAWAAAGHHFPGQTEVCARAANRDRFGMMFVARSPHTQWRLIAMLATTHISLRQVPEQLTPAVLRRKLQLLIDTLRQDFGIDSPRVAVAGLNPHSGEAGQLGREEIEWIEDVIQEFPEAIGPIPPDTMWVPAGKAWFTAVQGNALTDLDAYLALYHDQGLIPVKLMAFDRAVNVTVGLPFIRTSPDHGTAFDIAGQGIADPRSLIEAINLAAELARKRSSLTAPSTL